MTHRAERRDDIAGLISDMEPGIRDLVRWAQVVTALGASDTMVPDCLSVVGDAMTAQAVATEADWERCIELARNERAGKP